MNEKALCDPECKFLTPTEEEQTSVKEVHWCNKYKRRVFHKSGLINFHPLLVAVTGCSLAKIDYKEIDIGCNHYTD